MLYIVLSDVFISSSKWTYVVETSIFSHFIDEERGAQLLGSMVASQSF